jgi:Flp pilus assembly protein TadG
MKTVAVSPLSLTGEVGTAVAPGEGRENRRAGWAPPPTRQPVQRFPRGQALPEFAVVGLVLLTLLFGVLVLGMAVYSYSFVSYAAREAARYAIVHGAKSSNPASAATIQNYVVNEASGLDPDKITVSTTWNPNNNPGSVVKVTVSYSFQPFFPLAATPITLSTSSQMVISR